MSDKVLNRLEILDGLKNKGLKREPVTVEDLGGEIMMQELTAGSAMELNEKAQNPETAKEAMVLWCIASAIDADGNPLFTDADKPALLKSSARIIMTLSNKAMDLSGYGAKPDAASTEKN